MARATPLRQQYLDIKADYPDCILFFRLGDFYETFDEDAEVAARALDLTLTSRPVSPGKNDSRIPMAGVPHHALENYIARLIDQGFHVAVCDQVGEAPAKGIIERKVSRVVTPGTVIEPELLSEDRPNYLLALLPDGDAASGRLGGGRAAPGWTSAPASSRRPGWTANIAPCWCSRNWRVWPRARCCCRRAGRSEA